VDAEQAGVDAVIIPDLLPEESDELSPVLAARGVRTVFLLAPTSGPERIEAAARAASGFLYFVSVTGVTGARKEAPDAIGPVIAAVRAKSPVPVVIGFGVGTPEQAKAMGRLADGVVVGSAIVQRIAQAGTRTARAARVKRFVASLKQALR
jgi:tryptophan synthase alpha chain